MRKATYRRKTPETEVIVKLNLDGEGRAVVETGVSFLNHMLNSLAKYSLIDLEVRASGDLKHHIVEDTAICLGKAFKDALGKRENINRFGYSIVPMDDSLVISSIDLTERPYHSIKLSFKGEFIEDVSVKDLIHFFRSLASSMEATIHIYSVYGFDDHHMAEAAFKSLALAIKNAVRELK